MQGILYCATLTTDVNLEKQCKLSNLMARKTEEKCHLQKAIVGQNAFMQTSAAHHRAKRQAYAAANGWGLSAFSSLSGRREYEFVFGAPALHGGTAEHQLDERGGAVPPRMSRGLLPRVEEDRSSSEGYRSRSRVTESGKSLSIG